MSVAYSLAVLAGARQNGPLEVPSVIFPLVAIGVFALLAAVTWSYRDVAGKHATKLSGDSNRNSSSSHGSGH